MDLIKSNNRLNGLINAKDIFTEVDENPSEKLIETARKIVGIAFKRFLKIPAINPSHEGGILPEWVWVDSEKYILIELTNDGDLILLQRSGDKLSYDEFLETKDLFLKIQ